MPRKSATSTSTRRKSPTAKAIKPTKSMAKTVKKMDNASYFATVLFVVLSLVLAIIILMNMQKEQMSAQKSEKMMKTVPQKMVSPTY